VGLTVATADDRPSPSGGDEPAALPWMTPERLAIESHGSSAPSAARACCLYGHCTSGQTTVRLKPRPGGISHSLCRRTTEVAP